MGWGSSSSHLTVEISDFGFTLGTQKQNTNMFSCQGLVKG